MVDFVYGSALVLNGQFTDDARRYLDQSIGAASQVKLGNVAALIISHIHLSQLLNEMDVDPVQQLQYVALH